MTTYNHTAVTVGAAANAATVNAPLGQLDEAIGDISALPGGESDVASALDYLSSSLALGGGTTATTLTADKGIGNTTMPVTSASGFAADDLITVQLDSGDVHETTIASINANDIIITDGLPSAATTGNVVSKSLYEITDARRTYGTLLKSLLAPWSQEDVIVVAGVIQQDTAGGSPYAWDFITAGNHDFFPDTATVSVSSTRVNFNYGLTVGTVVAFLACPDETMAEYGYSVGASVTTTGAGIEIYRTFNVSGRITYGGATWSVSGGRGIDSVSWDAGNNRLLVNHADVFTGVYEMNVSSLTNVLVPHISGVSTGVTRLQWRDWAGALQTSESTNMDVWFHRQNFHAAIDPTTHAMPASSNIWCLGVMLR